MSAGKRIRIKCFFNPNCAIRKVFIMSKMKEIYEQYKEGKKFKTVSELLSESLNIKSPADLVGTNKVMQELAKKHSKYFKRV